jgi:hypothetical protein
VGQQFGGRSAQAAKPCLHNAPFWGCAPSSGYWPNPRRPSVKCSDGHRSPP